MKGFTGGGPNLREGRENKWMSRAENRKPGDPLKEKEKKKLMD